MKQYKFPPMHELPVCEDLPDLLGGAQTAEEWAARRSEIQAMLEHYMLGARPVNDAPARGEVRTSRTVYGGAGVRDEVRIYIGNNGEEYFDIYIVRPNRAGRFPAVVWTYFANRGDCPIGEELIERGIVLAAFENNALCKDDADDPASPAKRAYPDASWQAIMIWAWGFSKIADTITTLPYIDAERLMCTGHSRNGKAALVAGAYDERFLVVAPNNSGCGGAGCFRFLGDERGVVQDAERVESLGRITRVFPHWFSPALAPFGSDAPPYPVQNEARLPFDLHFLKALVAPRALITVEGIEDVWANVHGSYITRLAAQPAFELTGAAARNHQIIRNGGHEHGARDWRWMIEYATSVFEGKL
ncbi:MAG: hypothetical protein ACOYI5_09275 [Christensenellales bacterium]|jgi:hypothetical protein